MKRVGTAIVTPVVLFIGGTLLASCVPKPQPVILPTSPAAIESAPASPAPAASTAPVVTAQPLPPPTRREPDAVVVTPIADDVRASSASLDDLNRDSRLKPIFFEHDSADVSKDAQTTLDENASILKANPTWTVTIEGHCDETGTAEYNLALGERRAFSARAYLVSLGIAAARLSTVSYGKEFPFDPGHDEAALAKNRRAHFVITAK